MNSHALKWLPFCAALLMAPVVWAQTPINTPAPSPTPTPGVKNYKFKIVNPNNNAETSVRGINNQEVFVGDTASEAQVAAFTENGFVAKGWWLQQFSVPASFGATDTDAQDISNQGVILGMYDVNSIPTPVAPVKPGVVPGPILGDHGFLLKEGKFIKLPDPDTTTHDNRPDFNGINAENEIVGTAGRLSDGQNDSFILENGKYKYYSAPAPYVNLEFNGINDREAVVGEVSDSGPAGHGVLFKHGKFYVFDFPGSIDTIAFDINNNGDIAGAYTTADFIDHGFILKGFPEHPKWFTVDNGNPTYPDTTIRTINDQGVIGGVLSTGGNGPHTEVGFVAEPKTH